MMKVWVLHGIHEGEMFASTHLTEKGAALAAISDVLDFLGVTDAESADAVLANRYEDEAPPSEWDVQKMKDLSRSALWVIFRDWSQLTWDNDYGYQVEVSTTEISA